MSVAVVIAPSEHLFRRGGFPESKCVPAAA